MAGARCIDADANRAVRQAAIVHVFALASRIHHNDAGAGRIPGAGNKKPAVGRVRVSLGCGAQERTRTSTVLPAST